MKQTRRVVASLALVTTVAACASVKPPMYAQRAEISVQSHDTGGPVEGATVRVNGQSAGATSSDGRAEVSVSGQAGDKFNVDLTCPDGFRPSIPDSQDVFVTPTLQGPPPKLVFRCEASMRKALIDVRAENGPNLPVRYLGREIGRTDAQGLARVAVETAPGDSFELLLDTTAAKTLHPQSPTLSFTVAPGKPASFVFAQKFTAEKPKLKPRVKRSLPTNISPSNH